MTEHPHSVESDLGLTRPIERVRDELDVVEELLDLDGKEILELGCGAASKTFAIARGGHHRSVLALEVDEIQHALNVERPAEPGVRFALGGAEHIPIESSSVDVVFLFKSLHHVPVTEMDRALVEIARVLRPGGHAYISEPIYRGTFNDLLRLFNDEKIVREEAFAAIERAVERGPLERVSQTFFRIRRSFASFDAFESSVVDATDLEVTCSVAIRREVRGRFEANGGEFEQPIRVDLLIRSSAP